MMKEFTIIAITTEFFFPEESKKITEILSLDKAHLVHIRKPGAHVDEIDALIQTIPSIFHHRLRLHDGFELIDKYGLGGVHLNSRNPVAPQNALARSISAHSVEELNQYKEYEYITLSPIFDSISKKGYYSPFDLNYLKIVLKGYKNIIALGGVTPDKFPLLKETGFSGAALLGYFFPPLHLKPTTHKQKTNNHVTIYN